MNITVLAGSVPSATFIDAQVNAMAEDGFAITIIGKRTGVYDYHKNVRVIVIPDGLLSRLSFIAGLLLSTGFRHFLKIIKNRKGIAGLYNDLLFYLPIIQSKPDRIHVQWAAFIHNRDLLFELYPQKILVSLRGAHINYTPITTPEIKESYLRLFPKVHRFHAVSKAITKEAVQYGAEQNTTDIIYSLVDDKLLQKEIQPKTPHPELRIISVGRFFWKKGYEYALDALAVLKREGVPFTYTLIAEGKTPASILYQLHHQGINDEVRIINGLPHDEVLNEIERHDVLLLPSVEEGIANVALEAMATGIPVISSDVGGMKETIDNGISGYLVAPRDIKAIAETLKQFASLDEQQRYTIATNAKEAVSRQHNKQSFTSAFTKFYNH
jgi:glycosyltransferase involved in cell wall biosynthesis